MTISVFSVGRLVVVVSGGWGLVYLGSPNQPEPESQSN